jgi:hemerythrin
MNKIFFPIFCTLLVFGTVFANDGLNQLDSAAAEVTASLKNVAPENLNKVNTFEALLNDLLERIRVRVEERHQSAQDLIEKVKELAGRLNQLQDSKENEVKALFGRLNGRVKDLVESIIDKLTSRPRKTRSIHASALKSTSDEDLLKQLNWDRLMLETFIRTQLDEVSGALNRQRRQADSDSNNPIAQIREVFDKFVGHFLARYNEFTQWLASVWKNGIEQAKGQHERLVAIATEVIADAKDMQKETLRESLEILRPYRKELGSLWTDLVAAVNKALKN